MARFVWNEGTVLGAELSAFLRDVRKVLGTAVAIQGRLLQMTDAQVAAAYGFSNGVDAPDNTAGHAAKEELLSDVGKLLTNSSQADVNAALKQMLDQFA